MIYSTTWINLTDIWLTGLKNIYWFHLYEILEPIAGDKDQKSWEGVLTGEGNKFSG